MFTFLFLGLSKVVADILCAIRMSGSRPYELSCHNGTPSFHVHPVFNHGRANGPRWEPELFYRCFYTKTADFFLLLSESSDILRRPQKFGPSSTYTLLLSRSEYPKDKPFLLKLFLVHIRSVEADTTISGVEMEGCTNRA